MGLGFCFSGAGLTLEIPHAKVSGMSSEKRRSSLCIGVLGDGGWGTTLAIHLAGQGHTVRLWGAFPAYVREVARSRQNKRFLPGVRIPRSIDLTSRIVEAVQGADLLVLAAPSQHMRGLTRALRGLPMRGRLLLSVAKGLERGGIRMTEVIRQELGAVRVAALSGPNIACEIARGQPASSVVASHSPQTRQIIQRAFMSERFRVYTSSDLVGVELGGAFKNPIAIAAGISDGLGFGSNAKAALIARGIVEISRLGVAMGAREQTFWGLSGLGDLVTTCTDGRNRWLGEQIGRGRPLGRVLASTPMVIEGVEATRVVAALARRHRITMPIIEQLNGVLFRRLSPKQALRSLMIRSARNESN